MRATLLVYLRFLIQRTQLCGKCDRAARSCANCKTRDTRDWTRSRLYPGSMLCKKCGAYERRHQRARPLDMRRDLDDVLGSRSRLMVPRWRGPMAPLWRGPRRTTTWRGPRRARSGYENGFGRRSKF
ncbi:hypothetical protein B0H17DRAFT_924901 [Mycena rosella]|uniref:GATA-type domain-containing protein n=1 Tax=Mycena rosella TaxID=1033263 RepID=A0AAD7DWV9_MYCRO|nr:hypothetical protein B0H17DRAFT_924901 [Mycena rosella]